MDPEDLFLSETGGSLRFHFHVHFEDDVKLNIVTKKDF